MSEASNKINWVPDIDMEPGETLDEAVRRHNEKINAPVARTD